MKIKNNRNSTIQFSGLQIGPLATITIGDDEWGRIFAKDKFARELLAGGFIVAEQQKNSRKSEQKKEEK